MRGCITRKGPPPADFDENPEWTEDDFRAARPAAEALGPAFMEKARLGRPKAEVTKEPISLRLDVAVVTHLRAKGKGWQTQVNEALAEMIAAGRLCERSSFPPALPARLWG